MTVSTETARSGPYLGNGVTVSFAYSFRILDEAHLRVTTVDSAGRETVLTLETDYSVTGVGDAAGGSVILAAPLASGAQLVITRELPATQETDLENQGAFFAQTIEDALDKLTMLVQEGAEVDSRTLTLPITSTGVSASLPGVAPNNVIGWNAAGTALENKVPNDGAVLPAALANLDTAEINQLANVDDTTISAAQWGYLGGLSAAPLEPNAPATVTDLTATNITAAEQLIAQGSLTAAEQLVLSGALTPAQITADQNDYDPTGLATASCLRLFTDDTRTVTGLAGGAEGRMIAIQNLGLTDLILEHESTSSKAANRFSLAGAASVTLSAGESLLLRYDSVQSTWRGVNQSAPQPPIFAPLPTVSLGVGQFARIISGLGGAWELSSGGTWAYFGLLATSGGAIDTHFAGVAAGGTQVGAPIPNTFYRGFEWRIA